MNDCLFCKIIKGEIPSKKVYEDENTYAFYDISPQAPVHVLVINKKHNSNIADANDNDPETIAQCMNACVKVSRLLGIDKSGYRVVSNCGDDACQTVKHMHFHILGGKQLSGKMA